MTPTIKIPFYPGVSKENLDTGTISQIGWHRKEVTDALNAMFHIKENETIVGITISEAGIKAKIEYLNIHP